VDKQSILFLLLRGYHNPLIVGNFSQLLEQINDDALLVILFKKGLFNNLKHITDMFIRKKIQCSYRFCQLISNTMLVIVHKVFYKDLSEVEVLFLGELMEIELQFMLKIECSLVEDGKFVLSVV